MKVKKEELVRLIELCWRASQEAPLPGYFPAPNVAAPGQVDLVRYKTYEILLTCLLPKGTQHVVGERAKEEWEET